MKVDFYEKVYKRDNHRPVDFDKLIERSTTSDKLKTITDNYRKWLKDNPNISTDKKQVYKNDNFYDVQFSGLFSGTGKSDEIVEMSGLIVVDLDHIDKDVIRKRLKNDVHTYLIFDSPSDDGLKVIIRHNLKDPLKWKYLFREIQDYYRQVHKIEIDDNGSDISRMCHVPFMYNFYMNPNSITWNYKGQFEPETPTYEPIEIDERLYQECFYISRFISEHKINMCESYNDWLTFGFSLCNLGEKGRNVFHHISSVSKKYRFKECDEYFTNLLNTYDPDRSNINVFLYHSRKSITLYMLYECYEYEQ